MAENEELFAALKEIGCRVEMCGSRVTCNPAPTGTDEDYLVEIEQVSSGSVAQVVQAISGAGFNWEGSEHYQNAANTFMSWRKGETNLIVTASSVFAERHRAATHVCTRLNLLNKPDRIALFQAVLYGNQWDGKGDAPCEPAEPEMVAW
jgi:hypothetical protein